jgi:NhaA family Na+:H+ antiporter
MEIVAVSQAASDSRPRVSRAIVRFVKTESAGGVVMMTAAAIALIVANTPLRQAYQDLWYTYAGLAVGDWTLKMSLLHWVNDGLMAVFFFVVGLEIKREILVGELASVRRAALPVVAALGGAVLPAFLYWLFNRGGPYVAGWGVPMATDIAFAVAILALLGSRAPLWIKTFVTALAIADDLMAVLVIAIFYSGDINLAALAWAGGAVAVLFVLNRAGVQRPLAYVIPTLFAWYFVYQSGIHATIAGVACAAMIPAGRRRGRDPNDAELSQSLELATSSLHEFESQLEDDWEAKDRREDALVELADEAHESSATLYLMEHAIHPWVAFLVLPVFAFANAGIAIPNVALADLLGHPLPLGIIVGLFVGKQLGITGFTWLAVRLGLGSLPEGASWRTLWGGAALAGIGFTMSIFIASLAFIEPEALQLAKIGIIVGSLASAIVGILVLRSSAPSPADTGVDVS